MDRIFFFGGGAAEAHDIAKQIGFNRGEYIVILDSRCSKMRGLRNQTLFVVGNADARADYHQVVNGALVDGFTVIYITAETLKLID
ncbi:hypothetical protein D3C80_1122900 [compost metagenome]